MTNSIFFDVIWFLNGQEDGSPNINIASYCRYEPNYCQKAKIA